MKKVSMFAITFLCLWTLASAEDQNPEMKKIESKPENNQRAKYVDFSAELDVPISSLDNLGERIDQARLDSNPIELAEAAMLLKAVESLSGKTATLNSKDLMKEAVELAQKRGNPVELGVMAKMIGGAEAKELSKLAGAISEKSQAEEGEASRDIYGTLRVTNIGHNEVHVYVDGYEVGHVHGHSTRNFHVHNAVVLEARDHHGHRWHTHVHQHVHHWHWRLNPPHHNHHHYD